MRIEFISECFVKYLPGTYSALDILTDVCAVVVTQQCSSYIYKVSLLYTVIGTHRKTLYKV